MTIGNSKLSATAHAPIASLAALQKLSGKRNRMICKQPLTWRSTCLRDFVIAAFVLAAMAFSDTKVWAKLQATTLRCEYLTNPLAIETPSPRLSWLVEESDPSIRGQKQSAYRLVVASRPELLEEGKADLWDSQKVQSDQTLHVEYAGKAIRSGLRCWWKVQVWDKNDHASKWSEPSHWQIGLISPEDWKSDWIAFRDETPVHADRKKLNLPAARYYRKDFVSSKPIRQATVYASALGNYRLYLDGNEVSDGYFLPGWSDFKKRAYYQAFDVTNAIKQGSHRIGAVVTEGWYAGYVGYGLLVGYGPHRSGKNFYGKTPALRAQMHIIYEDGTEEIIGTDTTWQVSSDGPIREADIIMGETYDATQEDRNWCQATSAAKTNSDLANDNSRVGKRTWNWQSAILARDNGSKKAPFFDTQGERTIELGFESPLKMQSYPSPPVRIVGKIPAKSIVESKAGGTIFDLGQNFAGVVKLRVKEKAGTRLQIQYGEMLHPDGRLMTENLRRARATDFYVCRGDDQGEEWTPEFTYHGFQYVEVSGLTSKPTLDTVTGLVLTNDIAYVSSFACSDPLLTQFWKNGRWTQQANFVDIPTDCPQRDERLGWMGDAQAFVRTASYNADIAAFFTKWLSDLEEAQRESGAYPDYAPYPMAHGGGKSTHGTAWTDAGVICPWTIWKVYDDRRLIEKLWPSMTKFMEWRLASDPNLKGVNIGNPWGDWLNVNEETTIEYIDLCYHAYDCRLMAEMATALGKPDESAKYEARLQKLRQHFQRDYIDQDGKLKIQTQSAGVLAISSFVIAEQNTIAQISSALAERIEKNGNRMATGFLGTKSILPALSSAGKHDLACRLFQSREFPSWGYEVSNGATSVWERWDSYTREHGFDGITGKNNAAMNSFSHYAFGAVMEWAYRDLVGIDTQGPGFKKILIKPGIPSDSMSNIDQTVDPIHWAQADFMHHRGMIRCKWSRVPNVDIKTGASAKIKLDLTLPPNTTARVWLPTREDSQVTESQIPLREAPNVKTIEILSEATIIDIESGTYHFEIR